MANFEDKNPAPSLIVDFINFYFIFLLWFCVDSTPWPATTSDDVLPVEDVHPICRPFPPKSICLNVKSLERLLVRKTSPEFPTNLLVLVNSLTKVVKNWFCVP